MLYQSTNITQNHSHYCRTLVVVVLSSGLHMYETLYHNDYGSRNGTKSMEVTQNSLTLMT